MHRFISRLVPLVALSLIMSGCGGDNDPVAPPPATTSVISSFSGTLTLNGATSYSFTVAGTGGITAQLTSLQPDAAKPVGFSLGTWNGSICQIVLATTRRFRDRWWSARHRRPASSACAFTTPPAPLSSHRRTSSTWSTTSPPLNLV
jgi:hypothetical protein